MPLCATTSLEANEGLLAELGLHEGAGSCNDQEGGREIEGERGGRTYMTSAMGDGTRDALFSHLTGVSLSTNQKLYGHHM